MHYSHEYATLACPADIEPGRLQPKRLLSADELGSPTGARNRDNPVTSQAAVHTDTILLS